MLVSWFCHLAFAEARRSSARPCPFHFIVGLVNNLSLYNLRADFRIFVPCHMVRWGFSGLLRSGSQNVVVVVGAIVRGSWCHCASPLSLTLLCMACTFPLTLGSASNYSRQSTKWWHCFGSALVAYVASRISPDFDSPMGMGSISNKMV